MNIPARLNCSQGFCLSLSTGGCRLLLAADARYFLFRITACFLLTALGLLAPRSDANDDEWHFYRGVNLNGPAVALDGNQWQGDAEAQNFICKDERFENQEVALRPATDEVRSRMIRSSRWRSNGRNAIKLTAVSPGTYRVFLYTWEDSASQKFSISIEGQTTLSNYESGPAGTWKKLGPWDVAVSDQTLEITCEGGHANLSGLEVWRTESAAPVAAVAGRRTQAGLLALYKFDAGSGETISDRSGVGQPLDLTVETPADVAWQNDHLVIRSSARIHSRAPATKIIRAVKRSGEITIEAWLEPANDAQTGPARIITLSANPNERNFTFGQDSRRFDVRLRTTATSPNGVPSTATAEKVVRAGLTHVVYTRGRGGAAQIYVDGKRQVSQDVGGAFSGWNDEFRLALANELTGDRAWLGKLYLVAIYRRALTEQEVALHFRAGIAAGAGLAETKQHDRLFEAKIAPLLARNCLECHDSASKKGALDLSKKEAALAGGESGQVIVPGNSGESLLWELVSSGEMPPEEAALSPEEQALLREWIDAGASWSLDTIDPAVYVHDGGGPQNWLRRLTVQEYIQTVRSAVGVDIATEAREILPPDLRADGFSNTAYNLKVDLKHVEGYARLAEIVASRMDLLQFAARFSKSQSLSTDDTMRDFVAAMGKWLLRGPLEEREVTNFSGIATTVASTGGDFKEAVRLLVEAMLQSPRFIYRIENQRGDGTAWPVGDYELASRLSYMIWGGPPDEQLMRAADARQLRDPSRIEEQVERMLSDPLARERSLQFIAEWLNLDRLENLQPNAGRFPGWNSSLAADMRRETLAFFEDLVWKQNRPLADLLNAQFTYATPQLARHYGLEPQGDGFTRYDLSSVAARSGLLTQGSVLTAGGDDASMVTRGLFVLHDILRGTVKDPPPGLDTTPVPSKPGLSQRVIAEQRIANEACGGCHSKFEPLAFGLERFDGLGTYRETDEHGNALREDGEILFPGAAEPSPYRSSAEMMNLIAGNERVRETITWKLGQFALGRPLGAAEARRLSQIHAAAGENGGTYASVITALATSELVMMTRTEEEQAASLQ